jgi:hypothetical protein
VELVAKYDVGVVDTGGGHSDLQISPRIFEKIQNDPSITFFFFFLLNQCPRTSAENKGYRFSNIL